MEVAWKTLANPLRSLCRVQARGIQGEIDRYTRRDNLSFVETDLPGTGITKAKNDLQFSQSMLKRSGSLRKGEIPEPLKCVRPFRSTTLENGIRVCSEYWPGKSAAVGVIIGAGSRHETLETSGTAHFMEHLHFKGTAKRTRHRLETEVENMGAHLNAYTSREMTIYYMQVFKENVPQAVDILGDMLLNSLYTESHLEAERSTILQELEEVNKDPMEVLLENAYTNAYREHMMGQPILGDRGNIMSVTRDMVVKFHAANYFGGNMVLVGTGEVDHDKLVEYAREHFSKCNPKPPEGVVRNGTNRPIFTPGLTMIRDDEMENCCTGIFYNAPSWMHEDYYAFLVLERIFGTYTVEQQGTVLNDVNKQYNTMHKCMAKYPDIIKQQAIYSPYLDCGLFGNYFIGNEAHVKKMNYYGLHIPTKFADYIDSSEVERAKMKIFTELAMIETTADVMQSIGQQMLYWNRRVPRSEIAKRISNFTTGDIRNVCNTWFYDAVCGELLDFAQEPSITNWGAISKITDIGQYQYFKVHTTSPMLNYKRLALQVQQAGQ